MSSPTVTPVFNPQDLQGNILRGYKLSRVRHMVLEVVDAAAARRWLGATVSGGDAPAVTTEAQDVRPDACFNIGVTYAGLRKLGVPQASLSTFPDEFVQGMNARAVKLGDVGESAPEHWAEPFSTPECVHLIVSAHADTVDHLDRARDQVTAAGAGRAFSLRGIRDGYNFNGDYIHFDYKDSISQPRFLEIHGQSPPDSQPRAPLGAMLLGYPSDCEGLVWSVPQPDVLGRNGTFNAFRVLAQDVAGFETYLDDAANTLLRDPLGDELLPPGAEAGFCDMNRHQALREIVAAKMCGRWRNGVPLSLSPDTPNPKTAVSLTDFDYHGGDRCPFGSHTRRVNPRGGTIVQRAARHTRRLIRRGMPYGPAWDPARPDTLERGLLGVFIGANLGAQFEAISCDWVNLSLQDPRITGTNDPLLGANSTTASWFDIPLPSGRNIRLQGLPRFVSTRGGAYTFLPSISAIRHIAAL